MPDLSPAQVAALQKARAFYVGHDQAVGVLNVESSQALLKSGNEGGAWGGSQHGGFPRGQGWGFTQGGPSQGNIAMHVEGHAAAIMWQHNVKDGTLIVDRPMCAICARDLPSALPPGATLRVVSEGEGLTIVRSTHALTEEIPPLAPTTETAPLPSANQAMTPETRASVLLLEEQEGPSPWPLLAFWLTTFAHSWIGD